MGQVDHVDNTVTLNDAAEGLLHSSTWLLASFWLSLALLFFVLDCVLL